MRTVRGVDMHTGWPSSSPSSPPAIFKDWLSSPRRGGPIFQDIAEGSAAEELSIEKKT